MMNGQNYLKIQYLLLKKENISTAIKEYYEKMQTSIKHNTYLQDLKNLEGRQIEKWTTPLNQKFALVCAALGITYVTPRQIQSCLTTFINRRQIKEHLDSLKQLIAHDYHLDSVDQLTNSCFPTSVINNQMMFVIQERWRESTFKGFEINVVQQMVFNLPE